MFRPVLAALLVLSFAATATAAERDPRREELRLNAADNALAARIAVTRADLGAGWRAARVPKSEEQTTCPGFNPDLSRFTITGKATTAYGHTAGASVVSAVEVYESRAEAIGDFNAAAKPAVARCLKYALERSLRASGAPARVTSARVFAAPRVGEQRIAYRVVVLVAVNGAPFRMYVDVVVLQRGRSIVALFFTKAERPLAARSRVARAVAARMR